MTTTVIPTETTSKQTQRQASPQHGGQLHRAAATFAIPVEQWLDLSTAINPFSWTPACIPQSVWQRLPDSYSALEAAAKAYYGRECVVTPGSQWLIQSLPAQFTAGRVWIPEIGYEEYRYQWQKQKHQPVLYQQLPRETELKHNDVVIVINPNNPTGQLIDATELLDLATVLTSLNGYLIVDEAFMDLTPACSLLQSALPDNIVVLRSIGKFFGLAGIRLGFAHCSGSLLDYVHSELGPWAINHPAVYLGEQALRDQPWQQQNREHIRSACAQLSALLQTHFRDHSVHHAGLFCSLHGSAHWAQTVFRHCAHNGILLRRFPQWGMLRFGLSDEPGLQKLDQCLRQLRA